MMERINLDNYEAYLLDYFEGNLEQDEIQALKNFALLHPELNIDLTQNDLPYLDGEKEKINFRNGLLKNEDDVPGMDLIEYLEGNLSEEKKISLEKQLAEDKELAADLAMLRKTVLSADESEILENKNSLVRSEEDRVLSNRFILYLENLLSPVEKKEFENELASDATLQKELELFKKTMLQPNLSVIYPDKENLKKEGRVIAIFSLRNVAAMAAAILLLIGLFVMIGRVGNTEKVKIEVAGNQTEKKSGNGINNSVAVNNASISVQQPQNIVGPKYVAKNPDPLKKKISGVDTLFSPLEKEPQLVQKKEEQKQPEVILPENVKKDTLLAVKEKEDQKNEKTLTSKKITNLLPLEEDDDELAETPVKKKNFWQRAAGIARQANVLGLKAVNGEEKGKEDYMISFNSFSIEKK